VRRLLGALAAALVAAVVPLGAGADDSPFEIDVIAPLTGADAYAGREVQTAFSGLEAYVNRTGRVRGRPVKFVIQDDESSPITSTQLLGVRMTEGVAAIAGTAPVASCLADAAYIQPNGPVLYCFADVVAPPAGGYLFSAGPAPSDQLLAFARYLRTRGWSRIGFIATLDPAGQNAERSLDAVLSLPENRGLAVSSRQHFSPADGAVEAQIGAIKASDAQVLVVWATGVPFATVLRGAHDGGLDLPTIAPGSNAIPALLAQGTAVLPRELLLGGNASQALNQVTDRSQQTEIRAYLGAMATLHATPDTVQTLAWDAGWLIVNAYRQIGLNATAEQVRGYLANLRGLAGVGGTYDFRAAPQRGLGADDVYVVRWDPVQAGFVAVSRGGGRSLFAR